MIRGTVKHSREAVVALIVRGPDGAEESIATVVDTGFDGWLTLPDETVEKLGLVWRRFGAAVMADGREVLFDVYEGEVIWDGAMRRIAIDVAETDPLMGMSLLRGYELRMQVEDDGDVIIERLR